MRRQLGQFAALCGDRVAGFRSPIVARIVREGGCLSPGDGNLGCTPGVAERIARHRRGPSEEAEEGNYGE
jgi:hypothetical protein